MILVEIIDNPAVPCEACGRRTGLRARAMMGAYGVATSIILCETCTTELADRMWEALTAYQNEEAK